ncbi:MAG: hydrogenase expression/formation protein HypE [Myxococcota bacterium]
MSRKPEAKAPPLDADALASPSCPASLDPDRITLVHGAGAGASARLLEERVFPHLANPWLRERHDGAVLEVGASRVAFTTDTFVVSPLEFPGGDIGSLAVHGTLNDLAMCGARPLALSCALVLEEGLPLATLERVVGRIGEAARAAGVPVVTGDTKVVERGKGDGLFVNASGLGLVPAGLDLRPGRVAPGDAVLVSGPVGQHGAAVLSVREGLAFESEIRSDSQPLHDVVEVLLDAVSEVSCLRDPSRGGVVAVLHEIAQGAGAEIEIEDALVPVTEPVRSACELLGLDPLSLACEGRFVAFVAAPEVDAALEVLRGHPKGQGAVRVGTVRAGPARVVCRTALGTRRLLSLPAGEPLPRIC